MRPSRRPGIEHAAQALWLIGDEADRAAGKPSEAGDDVGGKARLELEDAVAVRDRRDHPAHVVAFARVGWNQIEQRVVPPFGGSSVGPIGKGSRAFDGR